MRYVFKKVRFRPLKAGFYNPCFKEVFTNGTHISRIFSRRSDRRFLTPLLLHRFKLSIPVVVAEIIMGLIIGKSGLNLVVQGDTWLETLSVLGFIFLMFLSGLEIDFSSFEKGKKNNSFRTARKRPTRFLPR